jgi:hypothetical protein
MVKMWQSAGMEWEYLVEPSVLRHGKPTMMPNQGKEKAGSEP